MDSLALLCTLHADGPQTLKRLRKAGCDSLQVLESFDPNALAKILDVAPAVGRRLAREARLLANRVEPLPTDVEEAPAFGARESRDALPAAPPAPLAGPAPKADDLDRRDRKILDQVMARWKGNDADRGGEVSAAESTPSVGELTPAIPVAAVRSTLVAGALDGLTEDVTHALAKAGVDSVTRLAECDASEAARASGLPFAVVRRFQFLAQRGATNPGSSVPQPAPAPQRGFSPAAENITVSEALDYMDDETSDADALRALAEFESEGTTLDWNFEIPAPPTRSPAGYDDPSGPFA